MKRTFAKLLSLFVVLTLVIAMVPAVFAVDGIVSVTAENTTLKVNKSTTVSVKDANGADVSNVMLTSSPADIVSISGMTITAQKVGSATITATVTEGGETQTLGSVTITVQSGVSAITPDTSSIEIDADNAKTASLSVTLTGAASGDVLAVRSSDESGPSFGRRFDRQLLCHADGSEDRHGCGHAQLRPGHTGAGRCDCQGDERPYRDL